MKKFLSLVLVLMTSISFAQVVKGKVMDATNHPLRGANIYFDGTTISTISYYLR